MTEKNEERFLPFAPMGTSVSTETKPIEKVSKKTPDYVAYKTHELFHRRLIKLAGTDTVIAITATNEDILDWEADRECFVVWIDTSGANTDRKTLHLNDTMMTSAYVLANTNHRFQAIGGRPYLFHLKKGDRIEVRSGTAAAGNHTAHIIGFYADER